MLLLSVGMLRYGHMMKTRVLLGWIFARALLLLAERGRGARACSCYIISWAPSQARRTFVMKQKSEGEEQW